MIDFEYLRATEIDAALRAGAAPSTKFVAGGTNIIDLMKLNVERPRHLVDINDLGGRRNPSLSMVADLPNDGLRLGALARMRDVAWDARVRERYPFVSQALLLAASGQLRNMATIGGNILQRTRCPYFRDTAMPCNKRVPGAGCSAIVGINRTEAILGTSDQCIATYPGDLAVVLVALDATVTVRGPERAERDMRFDSLHVAPGSHPERETTLQPGDLITSIDLPALPAARRSLYLKVRDRASFAFALASAAVAVDVRNGVIRDARVGLGGIATKPWRSTDAERILIGKRPTAQTFQAAADAALSKAKPHRDNAFKVLLAKRTLVRALSEVTA
ncbi:MAG TPA: xanthine dehydrogenase family protein subunit M [Gemmatimonadaceae bacterium]|nr:xanthine dehydrogenase family protein subunit M [Gemmatimonadaceae bacterium]